MKLVIFLILLVPNILPQENIQITMFEKKIEVTWDYGIEGPMMNWLVCYAQSADTSGFRFHNFMEGAPYEDMYEWFVHYGPYQEAVIWNKSFIFEEDSIQGYIKIGILGQQFDSTWLPAKTYGPFLSGTIGTPINVNVSK